MAFYVAFLLPSVLLVLGVAAAVRFVDWISR